MMPQQKLRNGNGPRQTYYVNKPIKSPHKTMFKTPSPLTYQFAHKKQMQHQNGKKMSTSLLSSFMLTQHLCMFEPKSGGSTRIR